MKVALFSDTFPPEINGVATSTANLQKTLKSHGHQCVVVTTNPFSHEVTFENDVIRIPGIEVKQLYSYRAANVYNAEAMKLLAEFRPDVVHCQTDFGIGVFGSIVASRLHVGMVYTFHTMAEEYAYYVTRGHFDRFARHAIRWYFRGQSNRYSEFIAPSIKIKNYLRSVGVDTPIAVIPTGIELERFKAENKEKTKELKERFGIAPEDYVILSLGRIAKEKSIDVLIDGYAKYLSSGLEKRPTKFVIVGKGPGVGELQDQANQLGLSKKVIFAGPCPPAIVDQYYHLGDCFASASVTETQGLTFMEAMAANLIVLARYDDNLVGTIQDGESGFFFDETDFVQKLSDIISLSSSEARRIKAQAQKTIDIYSMERFYQSVFEVYQRAVKKNW